MKSILNLGRKLCTTHGTIETKICIIGSGPAGFYAAQHLLKHIPSVKVDIYEKLPVPFGLVRFGVAPDHPEVKNVINTFNKTAENKNIQFIGNVCVGQDVSLRDLKEAYHAVLLTYGAEENRCLNIPGENLKNVIAARNIVGWYNGLPENTGLDIDLNKSSVAIFGQGNVAIDVARILLTPIDLLKKTDITQYALEALSVSKVKEIYLIGRRGPLQAAFTIKELREMLKLPNCATSWNISDFIGLKDVLPQLPRPRKRLTELMLKSLDDGSTGTNKFKPIFLRSPLEFTGNVNVENVRVSVNKLHGCDLLKQSAVSTEEMEYFKCDLAVTSIGYKSVQIDSDIPFDVDNGIAKNVNGKVSNDLYATGWVATGPTGVILTTMSNAFSTAEYMVWELKNQVKENKPGFSSVKQVLLKKGVQVVHWKNWLKINTFEQEEGKKLGKPREKVVSIEKMLQIAE